MAMSYGHRRWLREHATEVHGMQTHWPQDALAALTDNQAAYSDVKAARSLIGCPARIILLPSILGSVHHVGSSSLGCLAIDCLTLSQEEAGAAAAATAAAVNGDRCRETVTLTRISGSTPRLPVWRWATRRPGCVDADSSQLATELSGSSLPVSRVRPFVLHLEKDQSFVPCFFLLLRMFMCASAADGRRRTGCCCCCCPWG